MIVFFVLLFSFFGFRCESACYDPIAIYLTWQRSPETTMTISWITLPNRSEDVIEYQRDGDNAWQQTMGSHVTMPNGSPYFIHTVELAHLIAKTDYRFRTGKDGKEYRFRTMPETLNEPIRFVVGGDMYHDNEELLHETNRQAAKTDPMFALVGGDIAYATCKYYHLLPEWLSAKIDILISQKADRWLQWLIAWKNDMVTSDGRLVPLLPAIGNHDTSGRFHQSPEQAPFFYALFAMPGARGYNVLDFGDYMSIIILDTDHTHPIQGEQTHWLASTLQERIGVFHKFALYHVPAYPSVRSVNNEISPIIRKYWVPLFDQYGLTAAFENHDHAYKRTHLLLQNRKDPAGVLYLGDGAWGVKETRIPKQRWYLAKTASVRHFTMVTVDRNKRHFVAIASNGDVIDEFER
jgi:acid phosphatase type 7